MVNKVRDFLDVFCFVFVVVGCVAFFGVKLDLVLHVVLEGNGRKAAGDPNGHRGMRFPEDVSDGLLFYLLWCSS